MKCKAISNMANRKMCKHDFSTDAKIIEKWKYRAIRSFPLLPDETYANGNTLANLGKF
jgi:hypothetical protein